MGSNYVGVDSFSPNLTLQTDSDSPSAAVFRLPNERLLDNDVHLLGRSTTLETRASYLESASSVAALTATTASTSARTLATKTLAANEAVAGTRFRFFGQIRVARGATATATGITLRVSAYGNLVEYINAEALNTTNGYTGAARIEGEVSFHSAPGASASVSIAGFGYSTVASSTPVFTFPTPSLSLTAATNTSNSIIVEAFMTAATAGVSFTPISAGIHRLTP